MWIDPVLIFALALAGGALTVVAPLPALLAGGSILVLLAKRLSRRALAAALAALAAGALLGRTKLERFEETRVLARDAFGAPQRCTLQGIVDGSPTWTGRASYTLRVEHADCDSGAIASGARLRLGGGPDDLARGDRIHAVAQLAALDLFHNLELRDPAPFAARRGVVLSGSVLALDVEQRGAGPFALVDRARAFVRRRILATFAPAAQPMARALVLGENDLEPEDADAFRRSGLSHMLAVSGTHLVFAVVTLVKALQALLVRIERLSAGRDVGRLAAFAGIPLSLAYADFAGGSGSAYRAAWMLSAIFAARASGRAGSASRALAVSVLVGFAFDPLVAFDISFLLSAAATAGLLLLSEPLGRPCARLRSRVGRFVGGSIATTLSAMIPCTPLLALLGGELTLAGVFANVIAAPLGETVALPLCLLHALVSPLPALESGVGMVASGALLVVRHIAHESAAATFLAVPVPEPNGFALAILGVLGTALALGRDARAVPAALPRAIVTCCAALALVAVELANRRAGAPRGELRLGVLDVGQGDAALLDMPDGSLVLVDGGGAPAGGLDPGAAIVLPVLRARRRERLDVVVLSHPHPDHFQGLLAVAKNVQIGEFWDTGQGRAEGAGPVYAELLRELEARGVPVLGPSALCGAPRRFGAAVVRVLAPCPSFTPGRDANDNSFVFRVELGERAFLMTGDAEKEEEHELVERSRALLRADVLKVGHHGSRTSSGPALLAAVSPRVATISCGVRNRFGHPVPEVLARFEAAGIEALRSDRLGGISMRTDGASLELHAARAFDSLAVRGADRVPSASRP